MTCNGLEYHSIWTFLKSCETSQNAQIHIKETVFKHYANERQRIKRSSKCLMELQGVPRIWPLAAQPDEFWEGADVLPSPSVPSSQRSMNETSRQAVDL